MELTLLFDCADLHTALRHLPVPAAPASSEAFQKFRRSCRSHEGFWMAAHIPQAMPTLKRRMCWVLPRGCKLCCSWRPKSRTYIFCVAMRAYATFSQV